jgi:hypothetical protein
MGARLASEVENLWGLREARPIRLVVTYPVRIDDIV